MHNSNSSPNRHRGLELLLGRVRAVLKDEDYKNLAGAVNTGGLRDGITGELQVDATSTLRADAKTTNQLKWEVDH